MSVQNTGTAEGASAGRRKRKHGEHLPPIARAQSSIALNPIVAPPPRDVPRNSISGCIREDSGARDDLDGQKLVK